MIILIPTKKLQRDKKLNYLKIHVQIDIRERYFLDTE